MSVFLSLGLCFGTVSQQYAYETWAALLVTLLLEKSQVRNGKKQESYWFGALITAVLEGMICQQAEQPWRGAMCSPAKGNISSWT